jgi:hypothetical protein
MVCAATACDRNSYWPGLDRDSLAFPVDPWGKGKAFRCRASDCGTEVRLYVRAKIGFCNCTTGVADDEDVDRMGDLAIVGEASRIGAEVETTTPAPRTTR